MIIVPVTLTDEARVRTLLSNIRTMLMRIRNCMMLSKNFLSNGSNKCWTWTARSTLLCVACCRICPRQTDHNHEHPGDNQCPFNVDTDASTSPSSRSRSVKLFGATKSRRRTRRCTTSCHSHNSCRQSSLARSIVSNHRRLWRMSYLLQYTRGSQDHRLWPSFLPGMHFRSYLTRS
jgi:hypothetical protein